jgi:hypothetical protein
MIYACIICAENPEEKRPLWRRKDKLDDNTVICKPVSKQRVGKHVSAETRFLGTNHSWVLNVSTDTRMKIVDSRNQLDAGGTTGVSMDTRKQQTSPRITQRYISGQPDKNQDIPVWRRDRIPPL